MTDKFRIYKVVQEIEVVSDSQEHADEHVDKILSDAFDNGCGRKMRQEMQWQGSGKPNDYEVTRVFDWGAPEEEDTEQPAEDAPGTEIFESTKYGYCPHSGQGTFKCDKCGGTKFKSYPQAVDVSAPIWTYEYHCVNCNHTMGLIMFRR